MINIPSKNGAPIIFIKKPSHIPSLKLGSAFCYHYFDGKNIIRLYFDKCYVKPCRLLDGKFIQQPTKTVCWNEVKLKICDNLKLESI